MLDEYGDIPGQVGAQYATMDTVLPDRNIHHNGTSTHGTQGAVTFWMYNPPYAHPRGVVPKNGVRCGICKSNMTGYDHCPGCFRHRLAEA
jgi:hypothetical protein